MCFSRSMRRRSTLGPPLKGKFYLLNAQRATCDKLQSEKGPRSSEHMTQQDLGTAAAADLDPAPALEATGGACRDRGSVVVRGLTAGRAGTPGNTGVMRTRARDWGGMG